VAVKLIDEAVAQAEAAVADKEKALQKWMDQLQGQQNELQQQQQRVGVSSSVPPPPPPVQSRRQSVDRRMSVEPMACEDELDEVSEAPTSAITTNTIPISQPPPAPATQNIFNFGSNLSTQRTFSAPTIPTGFTIFSDKIADVPAAVKHAKEIIAANGSKNSAAMRPAPSVPTYARVNSAPSVPTSNLFSKPTFGPRVVTGTEDAQENLHRQHDHHDGRKLHAKCAWEGGENDFGHNNNAKYNAMMADGSISPWKKQRQFAGPVPVPTINSKAPTTHFVNVNLQALLAGQADDITKRKQ
jgi:hypothetical protein